MVKWVRDNQNKVILVLGMVLVAFSAFAGGILFSGNKEKEPLSISDISEKEMFSLSFDTVDGSVVLSKTDPEATIRQGSKVIPADHDGRFQFNLNQGSAISVFNQSNLINLDLKGFSAPQVNVENLGDVEGAEDIRVTNPEQSESPEQINLKEENRGSSAQEVPKAGQFVGSKNSDKYHVPSCRWSKKIKESNQVWFSSSNEAIAKGYEPCAQCIK